MVNVVASIFIARHERAEAAEVYKGRLSAAQREHLLDNGADYFLTLYQNGEVSLSSIED